MTSVYMHTYCFYNLCDKFYYFVTTLTMNYFFGLTFLHTDLSEKLLLALNLFLFQQKREYNRCHYLFQNNTHIENVENNNNNS